MFTIDSILVDMFRRNVGLFLLKQKVYSYFSISQSCTLHAPYVLHEKATEFYMPTTYLRLHWLFYPHSALHPSDLTPHSRQQFPNFYSAFPFSSPHMFHLASPQSLLLPLLSLPPLPWASLQNVINPSPTSPPDSPPQTPNRPYAPTTP